MENLRRFFGNFRRARVDSQDQYDAKSWTRILAMYQMMFCVIFLIIIPTYIMVQILLSGIVAKMYPQEPSCYDNNWVSGKTCRIYKTEELKFTSYYLIDAHLKDVALWFYKNSLKTIAHCVAAILLLLATNTDVTRSRQLKYCRIAITLNLVYLAQEYIKGITSQNQTTTYDIREYLCILYRATFHLKLYDFYCSIMENAQPPPGKK